jgi:hypothetical protein
MSTYLRRPFGPIRLPSECFEEIEPIRREDGKLIKRIRLKGTNLIGVQDLMDQAFDVGEIQLEPMKAPKGSLFFLGYKYGEEEK